MPQHFWPPPSRLAPAIALLFLSACAAETPLPAAMVHGPIRVAVMKRGWHTEIAFPAQALTGPLVDFGPAKVHRHYLAIGFGAREYFTKLDADAGDAAEALLPGPAAINLFDIDTMGDADQVTWLDVSQDSVDRMLGFAWQSMSRTGNDAPIPIVTRNNANMFYAARHDYNMLYNCNNWAVDLLRAGSLPFSNSGLHFSTDVQAEAKRVAGTDQAP